MKTPRQIVQLLLTAAGCILALLLPQLAQAQRDFSAVEVKVTHVAGSVHMLEGAGGNIGVSVGDDGILMVDDQFAPLVDKIRAALETLSSGRLKYVLNTHFHGDHTGGNVRFGKEATIIAHENVRQRLATPRRGDGRAGETVKHGLPVITFPSSLSVHFNDEEIEVIHFPRGHTDGDSVVFFKTSNVVHMGDLLFAGRFPFVDLRSGGDVEGFTKNVAAVMARLPPDVKLIPGHGALSTRDDLKASHRMLVETTALVRRGIAAKKSLREIQAAGLPAEWDSWGEGFIPTSRWIEIVHRSLTRSKRSARNQPRAPNPSMAPIVDKPGLPRVLVIGDSISIGYTLPTRERLVAKANVHRPAMNCGPTTRGLEHIESWLGDGRWDVIHFNWGLHDLKYVDDEGRNTSPEKGRPQVPLEEYKKNLESLVARLEKTGAQLIFATTTPVPAGEPQRVEGDARRYNAVALEAMRNAGVAINDLHGFAMKRLNEIQLPNNVHFTKDGSRALAEQVAKSIAAALGRADR